ALLEPFVEERIALNLRGEVVSLLAVAHANADRESAAKAAIQSAEIIAGEMDQPGERAKIFQRIGAAAMRLSMPAGDVERYLTRAVALASESSLFSSTARAYGALSNLSLFYDDDLTRCAWYSQQAIGAATKAGDRLALQHSL